MGTFRIRPLPQSLRLPDSLGTGAARLAPLGNLNLTKRPGSATMGGPSTPANSVRIFPNRDTVPNKFAWQPAQGAGALKMMASATASESKKWDRRQLAVQLETHAKHGVDGFWSWARTAFGEGQFDLIQLIQLASANTDAQAALNNFANFGFRYELPDVFGEAEISAILTDGRAPIRFDALVLLAQSRPEAFTPRYIELLIQLSAPGLYHTGEALTVLRRLLIHHCDALQGDLLVRAIDVAMASVSYAAGNEDDIAEFLLTALDYYPELFEERHLRFFTYRFMSGSDRAYLLERAPHLNGGDRPMPRPRAAVMQRVGEVSDLIAASQSDSQAALALLENAKRYPGLITTDHIHALIVAYRFNYHVGDVLLLLAKSSSILFSEDDVRVLIDLGPMSSLARRVLAELLENEPKFQSVVIQQIERKSVLQTVLAVAKLNTKIFNAASISALIQKLTMVRSLTGIVSLLQELASGTSNFQATHIAALISFGDNSTPHRIVAAVVLNELARKNPHLFTTDHIDPMVDVAAHSNPQYYVNQAVATLALRRRDLFPEAQVKRIREKNFKGGLQETVDILARNPMPRQNSPRAVVRAPSVLPDFSFGTQPVATPRPKLAPIPMLTPKEAQDNVATLLNIAPGHVNSFLGMIVDIGVDGQIQIASVQRIQARVTTSAQKAELDSCLTTMARHGNTRAQKLLDRFPFLTRDGGELELD